MTTANRSLPETTVIPVLAYPDVIDAAEWLCSAFGRADWGGTLVERRAIDT